LRFGEQGANIERDASPTSGVSNLTRYGAALIVDGDASFRASVSRLLARAGFDVCEAATGDEALAAARRERPTLVLLEVELSGASGYEICRALRDQFGDGLPIVFVSSTRTEPMDRVAGLLVGADDCLSKPVEPDELVARMRRLVTRSSVVQLREDEPGGAAVLTTRELEVLRLLAEGMRQKMIARELVISPKTVGTHIQRILAKLGVHSRAEAVAVAHREGWVADVTAPAVGRTA
jgi:two-component system, NarL family, nitrate/nitrite response regulator NarL